jgi:hypothetical protein
MPSPVDADFTRGVVPTGTAFSGRPAQPTRRAENHFWHFGHQNVERPFWVNRRTIPLQPVLWHFSPSRS